MTEEELQERREEIALEILRISRNTLLVNLRFLDSALSRIQLFQTEGISFATDGKYLYYDPSHLLKRYKEAREVSVHDYLHAVMHCIFRHMFIHSLVDRPCWDLACDIAVESSIHALGVQSAKIVREVLQEQEFANLTGAGVKMTAERLYRYFLDKKLSEQKLAELRGIFQCDAHDPWYMTEEEKASAYGTPGKEENGSGQQGKKSGSASAGTEGASGEETLSLSISGSAMEEDWKNLSEQMQMDLETFSKFQGSDAGGLIQNLKEVNREKYDYGAFLKKFAVMHEAMTVNDDEFDYIFYTYGLKLYGKVPLIEPLEYKDVKRIKEFVIAIDTSGSTSGDLVQKFVQKTYNILKSTESFFSKINLHIIQCDADIQEDVKITDQEEFESYLKTMKIRGLGGTDFRPVFSYVDELIQKKEFTNLKGLIYFTDGWGTFPSKKPEYDSAFVFIKEDDFNSDIPPWAIKLVLQKEEIEEGKW